jgi:hypothetical protein
MNDPQVTWYVIEDNTPTPYEDYYAGSYRPNDILEVSIQLWNNRWGQETVSDIVNSKLAVFFDTIEDSYLLNLCSIKIDDNDYKPLTVQSTRGYIDLGKTLSGGSNTGSTYSKDNYASIVLRFGPITDGMKNSLKNLFIDLEYDN